MAKHGDHRMSNGMKFLFGSISGAAATCIAQPLDLIKTRMQLLPTPEYRSTLNCFRRVIAREGVAGLYGGLGAALLRHVTHTTARLSIYIYLYDRYRESHHSEPPFNVRALMFLVCGACSAFLATPAEVVHVRMAADGRLPPAERRNYKNLGHAVVRIVRHEGFVTLFSASLATVGRIMLANAAQLASYSQTKGYLQRRWKIKQGAQLHFMASMCSGLLTALVSLPVDVAKTRLQDARVVRGVKGAKGAKAEYSGTLDVMRKVVQQEGIRALWKGFTPYFLRHGLHAVVIFVLWQHLNRLYTKSHLEEKSHDNVKN